MEDEFELSTVCHRPEGLEQLQEQTKFTRKELQVLYRGFKNVSGSGNGSVAGQSGMGPNRDSQPVTAMVGRWEEARGWVLCVLCVLWGDLTS